MHRRNQLRSHLREAWRRTIEHQYCNQQINSERSLQAFLCANLMAVFEENAARRRIFIEPKLKGPGWVGQRKPDILVCNTREIIGVIELKYAPKGRPRVDKDLQTLSGLVSKPGKYTVENDRYLGIQRDGRTYALARNAVIGWAGVHRGLNHALSSHLPKRIRGHFMELYAKTSRDSDPVYGRFK